MRHKKKLIALAVFLAASFYIFWPGMSPDLSKPVQLHLTVTQSFGSDSSNGNVVGIEPFMEPLDYASPERFQNKLDGYLDAAQKNGWIQNNTIVLLPEHIGTWLLTTNMGSRVYDAASVDDAMLPIVAANLTQFFKNLFIFDNPDSAAAAIIRARTQASADAQLAVYGALAKKYGVTLVSGSSAIMTPGVYADSLSYGHGPIFNAGFVFGPDGKPKQDAVRKVHPIPSETGFTHRSSPQFLPTFDVAGKKLAVLICADSWFDDTSEAVAQQGADLMLVPSFLEGTKWDDPWQGYLNDAPKSLSWRSDIGIITEGEAWLKYALPARAQKHGIRWSMNVFLKGRLWDKVGSGRAIIMEDGHVHLGNGDDHGAALYNLWLK